MKRLILVVEDDEDIRTMLVHYLVKHDFEVIENDDLFGCDLQQMPDLILMDNMLTGSLGKINCQVLKNNKYTDHIPVIIISASPVSEESLEAGAAAFIAKPFDLKDVLIAINKYMPY